MPTVRVNDLTLYYEFRGAGAPLLLIAGLNADHALFRSIVPRLAERFRVIVFDNRGIGQSRAPDTAFTIETLADDTAGLLAALGIARAHVLGVSLGGRIATALCLRHPAQVTSLILVSTSMEPPPQSWHHRWIGLLLRLPPVRKGNSYAVVTRQRRASRTFNWAGRLQEIRVPTLILQGQKDSLVPPHLAESMHKGIAGSTMITFGGGHLFFILRATEFVDEVLRFLESVDL